VVKASIEARGDLRLTRLTKSYGDFTAVDDLSLTIPKGSFFALLGPSGCGKTTTLRMIAGLEEPTAGSIHLGETDITTTKPYLPHLAQRKPTQLSGGQQQRIALARAIVNRPALLLLDEPLGALDLKLRRQMQIELKWIQKEVGLTFVHVTHDQEEAMTMADTIAVMNEGQIEQMGSPADLYDNPETAYVANFLGQSNLIKGTISGNDGDSQIVDLFGQRISLPKSRSHAVDNSTYAGIRPEKFRISLLETPVKGNVLTGGRIEDVSYIGVSTQYQVEMPILYIWIAWR